MLSHLPRHGSGSNRQPLDIGVLGSPPCIPHPTPEVPSKPVACYKCTGIPNKRPASSQNVFRSHVDNSFKLPRGKKGLPLKWVLSFTARFFLMMNFISQQKAKLSYNFSILMMKPNQLKTVIINYSSAPSPSPHQRTRGYVSLLKAKISLLRVSDVVSVGLRGPPEFPNMTLKHGGKIWLGVGGGFPWEQNSSPGMD